MGLYDDTSDIALTFGLGRVVQMKPGERPWGLLSSIADEMSTRGLMPAVLLAMTPEYANSVLLAINMDRAQAAKQDRRSRRSGAFSS